MSDTAPQNAKHQFPKGRRLLRHADFDRVYKNGRRHFAKHMTVFYLRRQSEQQQGASSSPFRIGFTVRKVLGGAVERNRMKRRLREAVRLQPMQPQAEVDIVINPKASLLTAEFRELKLEMAQAFQVIERSLARETAR